MSAELERQKGGMALYLQIAHLMRQHISHNDLRAGDRLPSEPVLSHQLRVSRTTVAKALDVLVSEGLVTRSQGRGTFVSQPPLDRLLPELTGFTEHVRSLGRSGGQTLISYETDVGGGEDPLVAVFDDGVPVVVVRRVRLVDGHPVGIHRTVLEAGLAERIGFTEERLASGGLSLYALLAAGGVELETAQEHLRALCADHEEATLLDVDVGTALMHVRRLSRDHQGRFVEAVDALYVGALYDYRIELVAGGSPASPVTSEDEHDQAAVSDADADPRPVGGGLRGR